MGFDGRGELVFCGQKRAIRGMHLHVDRTLQFQALATVMADAQNAGMVKVGIATDPLRPGEGK